MLYDNSTLFEEPSLSFELLSLIDASDAAKEDFKMLNDFPSICDLDPNEVVQKKCSGIDPFDQLFGSSRSQDKLFEDEASSEKSRFSFNTQELLEDLQKNEPQVPCPVEDTITNQKKINKRKSQRKCKTKYQRKSKNIKSIQKAESFDDRKRFCK